MLHDLLQAEDDATRMIANARKVVALRRALERWWADHSLACGALYQALGWFKRGKYMYIPDLELTGHGVQTWLLWSPDGIPIIGRPGDH